jgi:hypothetical protein
VSAVRAPVVAGAAGGVGTTTIATALRGRDAGRDLDRMVDILVCRCTTDSLARAAAVADTLARLGPRPVLAALAVAPVPARGPLHARLDLVSDLVADVVVLPDVASWHEATDPLADAATLLARPAGRLPRPLRAYAVALRRLVDAVVGTGRLTAPVPGEPALPRPAVPVAAGPPHPVNTARPGQRPSSPPPSSPPASSPPASSRPPARPVHEPAPPTKPVPGGTDPEPGGAPGSEYTGATPTGTAAGADVTPLTATSPSRPSRPVPIRVMRRTATPVTRVATPVARVATPVAASPAAIPAIPVAATPVDAAPVAVPTAAGPDAVRAADTPAADTPAADTPPPRRQVVITSPPAGLPARASHLSTRGGEPDDDAIEALAAPEPAGSRRRSAPPRTPPPRTPPTRTPPAARVPGPGSVRPASAARVTPLVAVASQVGSRPALDRPDG